MSKNPKTIKVDTTEPVSLASLASRGREALVEHFRAHANKPQPVVVENVRTPRQQAQFEAEIAAGQRAHAKFEASQAAERKIPMALDKSEGYTVPVFRPADHVPGFNSKDPASRTVK